MLIGIRLLHVTVRSGSNRIYSDYMMLAYWDTDLNKSVDFFLNPICIFFVVCTSTIADCIAVYAHKILFKLNFVYKLVEDISWARLFKNKDLVS